MLTSADLGEQAILTEAVCQGRNRVERNPWQALVKNAIRSVDPLCCEEYLSAPMRRLDMRISMFGSFAPS